MTEDIKNAVQGGIVRLSVINYVVTTLEAAATLIQAGGPQEQDQAILARTHMMLSKNWDFVRTQIQKADPDIEHQKMLTGKFWNDVALKFLEEPRAVYKFIAVYNETVNPDGNVNNTIVEVILSRAAIKIVFALGQTMKWKVAFYGYERQWQL